MTHRYHCFILILSEVCATSYVGAEAEIKFSSHIFVKKDNRREPPPDPNEQHSHQHPTMPPTSSPLYGVLPIGIPPIPTAHEPTAPEHEHGSGHDGEYDYSLPEYTTLSHEEYDNHDAHQSPSHKTSESHHGTRDTQQYQIHEPGTDAGFHRILPGEVNSMRQHIGGHNPSIGDNRKPTILEPHNDLVSSEENGQRNTRDPDYTLPHLKHIEGTVSNSNDRLNCTRTNINHKWKENVRACREQVIISKLMKNYSAAVRPIGPRRPGMSPHVISPVTDVNVTVTVLALSSFNDVTMEFIAQLNFQQEWFDHRLAFPQERQYHDDFIQLAPDQYVWIPDTFFHNEQQGHDHQIDKLNQAVRVLHNGHVKYQKRLTLAFSCPMNLQMFPHDDQTCVIHFGSYAYTDKDIKYNWNKAEFGQDADENLPKFKLAECILKKCDSVTSTGTYSCLEIEFKLHREFSFFFMTLYIPSCMLVSVSFVSFWIDWRSAPSRVPLTIVTLLTVTTQAQGINANLPPVSYTKAIDLWIGACTIFVFGALIEFAIVNYIGSSEELTMMSRAAGGSTVTPYDPGPGEKPPEPHKYYPSEAPEELKTLLVKHPVAPPCTLPNMLITASEQQALGGLMAQQPMTGFNTQTQQQIGMGPQAQLLPAPIATQQPIPITQPHMQQQQQLLPQQQHLTPTLSSLVNSSNNSPGTMAFRNHHSDYMYNSPPHSRTLNHGFARRQVPIIDRIPPASDQSYKYQDAQHLTPRGADYSANGGSEISLNSMDLLGPNSANATDPMMNTARKRFNAVQQLSTVPEDKYTTPAMQQEKKTLIVASDRMAPLPPAGYRPSAVVQPLQTAPEYRPPGIINKVVPNTGQNVVNIVTPMPPPPQPVSQYQQLLNNNNQMVKDQQSPYISAGGLLPTPPKLDQVDDYHRRLEMSRDQDAPMNGAFNDARRKRKFMQFYRSASTAEKIDIIARIMFPVGFILFNVAYWTTYFRSIDVIEGCIELMTPNNESAALL